jgi:hypothetical protein
MTETMIAYHGRQALKDKFLEQIGIHEAADRIQHTGYANFKTNGAKVFTGGCAIGCSLESLRVIEGLPIIIHSDHALYECYLGVPQALARLEDRLFENISPDASKTWPRRFAEAIRPGADLAMVMPRFLLDLLTAEDGAVQARCVKNEKIAAIVKGVSDLYREWVESGTKPSDTKWREARERSYAAAYAAAYAADAAAAYAADAAAYAADAYAAAAAGAASREWTRARTAEYDRQAAALIRLLEAA